MADEQNIQRIMAYLRQHRDQFEMEALRQQLLASGQDPADIAEAIARVQSETIALPGGIAGAPEPPVVAPPQQPVAPGLSQEQDIARVLYYLRRYKDQYELDALRQQLISAGQSGMVIDEAIRRLGLEAPPRAAAAWPWGCLVGLVNFFVWGFLGASVPALLMAAGVRSSTATSVAGALALLSLLAELIAGFVLLSGPRRLLGKALLFGVLFSFVGPLVIGALLFGICLLIIGGMQF
jgi:hypothetical protein